MALVTVDCGGTIFRTYKDTLIRGCPYFHAMFKGGFAEGSLEDRSPNGDQDQPIFLDMDPIFFRHALNRMRDLEYKFPKQLPGLRHAIEGFLGIPWLTATEERRIAITTKDHVVYVAERLKRGDRLEIYSGEKWYTAEFRILIFNHPTQPASWQFHICDQQDIHIVHNLKSLYDHTQNKPLIRLVDPDIFHKICKREYVRDISRHKPSP